jgi:hypothetical protein
MATKSIKAKSIMANTVAGFALNGCINAGLWPTPKDANGYSHAIDVSGARGSRGAARPSITSVMAVADDGSD